ATSLPQDFLNIRARRITAKAAWPARAAYGSSLREVSSIVFRQRTVGSLGNLAEREFAIHAGSIGKFPCRVASDAGSGTVRKLSAAVSVRPLKVRQMLG